LKLRILHVAALPFPSHQGTQVYVGQMCESQAERGHDVHLLTYRHGLPGYRPRGYTIHRVPDFPRYRSLRSGPSWRKAALDLHMAASVDGLVRDLEPDIVHAHNYEALAAALVGNRRRRPLLYHAHTLLEPELPCYLEGRAARTCAGIAGMAADRFLPHLADACATISPYLSEALVAHGVDPGKVHYVPPALHVRGSGSAAPRKTKQAAEADFIYIGNLDRYQGISDMLEGVARVAGIRGDVRVKIISDSDPGPYAAEARKLGVSRNVSFEPHGEFSTVVGRLASTRIALAPRKIPGGFPMKLINYLRFRKPVIASVHGSGGLRHGREALVYTTRAELVECALRLMTEPGLRNRIARNGCRYAQERFVWDRSLGILDGVYDSCLRASA
jgi:glycosyltransferase involved in cell wall biosynthesis